MSDLSETSDASQDRSELDLRAQIEARVAARRNGTPDQQSAQTTPDPEGPEAESADDRNRHRSPRRKQSSTVRSVVRIGVLVAIVLVVRLFVIASFYIPSGSMETTLHGCDHCNDDMVVVDKLSYRFGHVSRSDVVVFDRPPNVATEDKELIKRVIGLPGDVVSGHDGRVYIDNEPLDEPYVNPDCHGTTDFKAVTVPAGRYFMMGDNRCISLDSRVFGTVPQSAIVGRAFAIVWPLKRLNWL